MKAGIFKNEIGSKLCEVLLVVMAIQLIKIKK